MKKIILALSFLLNFMSFSQLQINIKLETFSDKILENAVIYEANIRQYSKQGTFDEFTKDIPKIKKLGVKILWLMPIFPIGLEKRKEGLGSYYSVKDYKKINPEFGDITNFRKLVNTAHANGLYVILDWVANHSAWDNPWVKSNPEFYAKDKDGKMISPFDWTDVVKFDYSNKNMREAMLSGMTYWLKNENVDGFRCDVAMEVPQDFWEDCRAKLNLVKPNIMLMEAEQPNLMEKAFDIQYAWEAHSLMNKIAKGDKTVRDWDEYMANRKIKFKNDDIDMNFTSNHDENSWNGSEYERLGNAVEIFATLSFMTVGMPLIYNGQEYDFDKRLKFFQKDEIIKQKGKMFAVYEKLGKLKNNNAALNGGKNPAIYKRITTSNDEKILVFEREKSNKKAIFMGNLSNKKCSFKSNIEGNFEDYMLGKKIILHNNQLLDFEPWQYKILLKD